jgi:hypothetical protein
MRVVILLLLVLSACTSFEAEQTLKRSGAFDLSVSLDSDYFVQINLSPRWQVTTIGNRTSLTVRDVHPEEIKALMTHLPFSQDKVHLSRTVSFPYFVFDYTIDDIPLSGIFTLKTFGTVIETNGQLISSEEVRFDLSKEEELHVVFRDPVFYTLPAQPNIQTAIGVFLIGMLIGFLYFKRKH